MDGTSQQTHSIFGILLLLLLAITGVLSLACSEDLNVTSQRYTCQFKDDCALGFVCASIPGERYAACVTEEEAAAISDASDTSSPSDTSSAQDTVGGDSNSDTSADSNDTITDTTISDTNNDTTISDTNNDTTINDTNNDTTQDCGADLNTDPEHCGACDNSCQPGDICTEGNCVPCTAGELFCEGECIDPTNSPLFCGSFSCDAPNVCAGDEFCIDGSCQINCALFGEEFILCDGRCVNTNTDRSLCGSVSCSEKIACASHEDCIAGSCEDVCEEGMILCGGLGNALCVTPSGSLSQGLAEVCPWTHCTFDSDCSGQRCVSGQCLPTLSCSEGSLSCEFCVDLSDQRFCGLSECSNGTFLSCEPYQACNNEACVDTCPLEKIACAEGCIEPKTDPRFCGASVCGGGMNCQAQGLLCRDGASCRILCLNPLDRCEERLPGEASPSDVCVNLQDSRRHCGACGLGCLDNQNCVSGTCQ